MHSKLNSVQTILGNDPGKMLEAVWRLPEQCAEALAIAKEAGLPQGYQGFTQIMVTGLGGSAIGGDLLRVYVGDKAGIPVIVNRDYTLPNFVGPQTLLFATSFSGNTEETLSAYQQAIAKGAKIVVITTGGKLKELAGNAGVPVITIPGGISPRAATGYLFIPTVVVLQRLGLIPDASAEIEDAISNLKELREVLKPESPVENNPAKTIALKVYNKIPVIYGASGTTEVVATRWKGQINENAKAAAYWNVLPEMNHNEIVGFEAPGQLLNNLEIIILRDQADHPRVQKRMEISKTIMGKAVSGITEVHSRGNTTLARTFSLTYIGDYVSVYLATLYGIDPTPVNMIDLLKRKLVEE